MFEFGFRTLKNSPRIGIRPVSMDFAGFRHDDYDYGEVNQLLERSLKAFIKSSCCYPERVTRKDYDRVLREFKLSEKVSGFSEYFNCL